MKDNNITIIGMSGVGKTYLSKLFAEKGWRVFCCDDEIEKKLDPWLKKEGYVGGVADVAKWMGQPYDSRYKENSQCFLRFEIETMNQLVSQLKKQNKMVIDATGSVIYTGKNILNQLKTYSKIVLIEAPQSHQDVLYQRYIKEPKPVIWADSYQPLPEESPVQALARCYPSLLARRNSLYKSLADITFDYDEFHDPGFGIDDFISRVFKEQKNLGLH